MDIYCGCSGFHYDEWQGTFYPEDLESDQWLDYYADRFPTVEMNSTSYGLPKEKTVQRWHDRTPADFRFALKGSQYVTHSKKLVEDDDLAEAIDNFIAITPALGDKLGPILWQLPGNFHRDMDKLSAFLERLPEDYRYVMEFRHASWFTDEVYRLLADHGVACCAISTPEEDLPTHIEDTADFVYVRLHGREAWYDDDYATDQLQEWLDKIRAADAAAAYVYFDNTKHGQAVDNARRFLELLEKD